jgi:hypothetical protein
MKGSDANKIDGNVFTNNALVFSIVTVLTVQRMSTPFGDEPYFGFVEATNRAPFAELCRPLPKHFTSSSFDRLLVVRNIPLYAIRRSFRFCPGL